MELIKNTPELLVFKTEASENLANAIRRSVNDVSSVAIDEVEFVKNDSALYDEVLAHRIGLIPLKTNKKMSTKTEVTLKLQKKGPCTVYSGDLEGGTDVVFKEIPLTILEDGQEIEFSAFARLGKGSEHTKYAPGMCYYRHILEVKSDPKIDKIVQEAKSVLKPVKKGSNWVCDLDEGVVSEIEKINSNSVKDKDELIFFVESFGQMDAKDILKASIDALGKNLDEFEKFFK